jgi:hypothetical protein
MFVFRAIMLKYEILKCHFDFFQLYNVIKGDFEILVRRQLSAIFWRSAALMYIYNQFAWLFVMIIKNT